MTVHVASITHKFGTNFYVAKTEERLQQAIYEFVVDYWDDYLDAPIPEDHEQAISEYFEAAEGVEFLDDMGLTDVLE